MAAASSLARHAQRHTHMSKHAMASAIKKDMHAPATVTTTSHHCHAHDTLVGEAVQASSA